MPRRLPAALCAAACLLAAAPRAADAQFGALKRKLEQEVAKAVTGQGGDRANAAPSFSDRVLEITDARLGQLVAGLRAEAAEAERTERAQAELAARAAAHQQASDAYGRCAEPFNKELLRYTGMTMGLAFAAKREQEKTGRLQGPMQDSLKAVTGRMVKVQETMAARCGEVPGDSPFEAMGDDAGGDPEATGAKAAGLTRDQYAVLRERVAAFLPSAGKSTGQYAYAAGERDVLARRAGDLAPFRTLLGA